MQPAYIDGSVVDSVELQTDNALTVARSSSAPHFLPLRSLSRIIVVGDVNWSTAALVACIQADIPVLFLASDGTMLGICCTLKPRKPSLKHALARMLQLPDIRSRLENWCASQEARQRWLFCKSINRPLDQMPPRQSWIEALDILTVVIGHDATRIEKIVAGQLAGALYEWMSSQGFSDHLLQGQENRLPVLASYQKALRWLILRLMLDCPPDTRQLKADCLRASTQWFHQHQPQLRKHVLSLHTSLHNWCIGEITR